MAPVTIRAHATAEKMTLSDPHGATRLKAKSAMPKPRAITGLPFCLREGGVYRAKVVVDLNVHIASDL